MWNGPILTGSTRLTSDINSIAWNGKQWVIIGNENNIYYSNDLSGKTGWTDASTEIITQGSTNRNINFETVIWDGKKWIAAGHSNGGDLGNNSFLFTSYDGKSWFKYTSNDNINPLSNDIYGLASNSGIGGVVVDSQITLSKNSGVKLTKKLDIVSDKYYNSGYNNMSVTIKSSDLTQV